MQISRNAWSYDSLHDARGVSSRMPTDDDIRTIVAFVDRNSRTLGPRGPVTFVAASGALFGMARMYAQIATGSMLNARLFQDAAAAVGWLDSGSRARSSQ